MEIVIKTIRIIDYENNAVCRFSGVFNSLYVF